MTTSLQPVTKRLEKLYQLSDEELIKTCHLEHCFEGKKTEVDKAMQILLRFIRRQIVPSTSNHLVFARMKLKKITIENASFLVRAVQLVFHQCEIPNISLSNLPLQRFDVQNSKIKNIFIRQVSCPLRVIIMGSHVPFLHIRKCPLFAHLSAQNACMKNFLVDTESCQNLQTLNFSGNQIAKIRIFRAPRLQEIYISPPTEFSQGSLQNVRFEQLPHLRELHLENQKIEQCHVETSSHLEVCCLQNNPLTNLTFGQLEYPHLQLNISGTFLTEDQVAEFPPMQSLQCFGMRDNFFPYQYVVKHPHTVIYCSEKVFTNVLQNLDRAEDCFLRGARIFTCQSPFTSPSYSLKRMITCFKLFLLYYQRTYNRTLNISTQYDFYALPNLAESEFLRMWLYHVFQLFVTSNKIGEEKAAQMLEFMYTTLQQCAEKPGFLQEQVPYFTKIIAEINSLEKLLDVLDVTFSNASYHKRKATS